MKKVIISITLTVLVSVASVFALRSGNDGDDVVARRLPAKLETSASDRPQSQASQRGAMKVSASQLPVIYGTVYSKENYDIGYGVVSFTPDASAMNLTEVFSLPQDIDYVYSGGGCYADGKYLIIGSDSKKLYIYDTSSWQLSSSVSVSYGCSDMTYDIATKTVYCCYYEFGNVITGPYYFGKLDTTTGEFSKLCQLERCFYALAADNAGKLYAIADDATLYTVSKTDGALTSVGATGVNMFGPASTEGQDKTSSATFDFATGKLYWCYNAIDLGTWGRLTSLYEVSTATGKASKILDFSPFMMFNGIYIPYEAASADAPAQIDDLQASFAGGGNSGTVTFTIPSKTIAGQALSGTVNYKITANGEQVATGSGSAGTKATKTITTAATENVRVGVTCWATSEADHSTAYVDVWVGPDAPLAVTSLTLSTAGNVATLEWEAPTSQGLHGGYVNPSAVSYKIIRQPDGVVCRDGLTATSFTETLSLDSYCNGYYEVIPSYSGYAGQAAVSNKAPMGPSFETPYTEFFNTQDGFDTFHVVDVAADGATWQYYSGDNGYYAYCDYYYDPVSAANDKPKDDWLISPPVALKAGSKYILSFNASSLMMTCPERLEVKLGKTLDPESFTTELLPASVVSNTQSWTWSAYTLEIEVPESGDYRIGFHAISDAGMFKLGIDDIRLDGSSLTAPATPSGLTAKPTPGGALSAEVSFVAPDKTVGGDALSELESAEIYVNSQLAKTINAPEVGKTVTGTVPTLQGFNDIDVICYSTAGERSFVATTKVYTGTDAPGPAKNVKAAFNADGTIAITWEAPDGKNGGYVDPDDCSYAVTRYDGAESIIAYGVEGTSYTDDYTADTQTVVTYLVTALNDYGFGTSGVADPIIIGGDPYELPFEESFLNGFSNYAIWSNLSIGGGLGQWLLSGTDDKVIPYDRDLGCLAFTPANVGDETMLFSGKIDISTAKNPTLQFYYFNATTANVLRLKVNPAATGWNEEFVVDLADNAGVPAGWTKVSVPLVKYKDRPYIQIGFDGIANEMSKIYVDKISIRDLFENDLAVELSSRTRFRLGEEYTLAATVTNVGDKDVASYKVNFCRDGKVIGTLDGHPLKVDEAETLSLPVSIDLGAMPVELYSAVVVYDADENDENDISEVQVSNTLPKYPEPTDLEGEDVNGVACLSWSAPAAPDHTEPATITDDFESYEPFIIQDIGEWLVYDEDGEDGTFGLLACNFPHRCEAKSFQVFNIYELYNNLTEQDTEWMANSGEQILASFADYDRKNGDWLISPELTGKAQTISFYAKSVAYPYPDESYEVLVSSTDTDIASFTKIKEGNVSIYWEEISVALPEGSKYFAIKCTSDDCFAMALDDVTYTPGNGIPDDISFIGYNVWRDGVKLTAEPITATEYKDTLDPSQHTYAVTAVYNCGDSRFSNTVIFNEGAGLADLAAADSAQITTGDKSITVTGARGLQITICNVDGRLVHNAVATGADTFSVAPGIYIVRAGSVAAKVIVR